MDEVAKLLARQDMHKDRGIFQNVMPLVLTISYEPHGSMLKGLSFSPGLDDCFCQKKKEKKSKSKSDNPGI